MEGQNKEMKKQLFVLSIQVDKLRIFWLNFLQDRASFISFKLVLVTQVY